MKKINLKSILKKTFKNKSKVKKSKKVKKIKKEKKIPLKKTKKTIKVKKEKIKNLEKTNNANLKVVKPTDQKPEIKKIKKQDTEKKDYKAKDGYTRNCKGSFINRQTTNEQKKLKVKIIYP